MSATEQQDVEVIVPTAGRIEVDDIPATVRRLKLLEFFGLLNVITTGMGSGFGDIKLNTDNADQMAPQIMGLLLASVPNAGPEFVAFIDQIVEPVNARDRKRLSLALVNPSLTATVAILATVVRQEKDEFMMLVDQLGTLTKEAQDGG